MLKWRSTAIPLLFAGVICLVNSETASGDETKEISEVCSQVQKLIAQYYPQAKAENKEGNFVAKYDTRTFMIHHALKTGEWQEARPQEGPNRKGIMCNISCSDGPWNGAAMVPQTFDYRYFSSLLMAPYNKRLNKHLTAHLNYPSGTSEEFLKSYQTLVSSFSSK